MMGPNMQKMFDNATNNAGWHPLSKDRADKRACESLVKAGHLQTRDAGDGKVEYIATAHVKAPAKDKPKAKAKDKAAPKVKLSDTEKPLSRMQQAIAMAAKDLTMTRPVFMQRLQDELGLTPAGANTYSSAAMKAAKAQAAPAQDEPKA